MPYEIKTINAGGVNCYLVAGSDGRFVLIDSGISFGRGRLVKTLENAGVQPGSLRLIVITHADPDHTGSAAFLRRKYGAKITMHAAEIRAAESGNSLYNRKPQAFLTRLIFSLTAVGPANRFRPDFTVVDGQDLSEYGLDAQVVHLPGHTFGELGVLTTQGDLFCGDMLMHEKTGLRLGYGNPADFHASLEKLKALPVKTFYPGHGQPFSVEVFRKFLVDF